MRHAVIAGVAAAALCLFSFTAEAAPVGVAGPVAGVAASQGVVTVSGGCGPRAFRAGNGRCYPRRPPPPRAYGRQCPPGLHLTPYGCRRNY